MKKNNDKIVGSIVFGVLIVITLNIVQSLMGYFLKDFTKIHPYITSGISGAMGALVALTIVNRFFENPFSNYDKK